MEALRAKGVPCRALVRDRARGANLLPQPTNTTSDEGPEFDIVTGDVYQFATLPAAFAGCNAVVVASAANDKSDPFGPFNVDVSGNSRHIVCEYAATAIPVLQQLACPART